MVTSFAENVNCAVVSVVVAGGPDVIVVCGGVVSTDHEAEAGVASTLPAVSFARTANVCAPSASAEYVLGDVHAATRRRRGGTRRSRPRRR